MARKVRGFERVLDAPALFAIAYGEIASSIYVALGIVAAAALGLTPLVLLLTGAVFLLVALSYAEGTAAIPETGGAETFTRRAFNDLLGFVTGWALFLDYLIVIGLSARVRNSDTRLSKCSSCRAIIRAPPRPRCAGPPRQPSRRPIRSRWP